MTEERIAEELRKQDEQELEGYLKDVEKDPSDFETMFYLGMIYSERGDKESAMRWLKRGCDGGDINCKLDYAEMLLESKREKDRMEAVRLLKEAKDAAGSMDKTNMDLDDEEGYKAIYDLAATYLGDAFLNGWGVKKDEEKAFELYHEAAENGCVPAGERLAFYLLKKGDGKRCVYWLKKMTYGANNNAIGALLWCTYQLGAGGVEPDPSAATEYMLMAAQHGNSRAMRCLAEYYREGADEENKEKAAYWYRCGAMAGDVASMLGFSVCLKKGSGVQKNKKAAAFWAKKAAQTGDAYALAHYGRMIEKGICAPGDENKAFEYISRATQRKAAALHTMGRFCRDGKYTPRDENKAFNCFMMDAVQGDADSLFELAECFAEGVGTEKNPVKAFLLFDELAAAGYKKAFARLGKMYITGQGVAQDVPQGVFALYAGVVYGDTAAMVSLAECFESGTGVEPSKAEAEQLRQEAQEAQNADEDEWEDFEKDVLPLPDKETQEICKTEQNFKRFFLQRCNRAQESKYLLDLIGARKNVMLRTARYMILSNFDLSTAGDEAKAMMQDLKSQIYFACAREEGLLVKKRKSAYAQDQSDLQENKIYAVLKITDEGDLVVQDDSGGDWAYPSAEFEILSSTGASFKDPAVRYALGEQEERENKYQQAMAFYLSCGEAGADAAQRCFNMTGHIHGNKEAAQMGSATQQYLCGAEEELCGVFLEPGFKSRAQGAKKAVRWYKLSAAQGNPEALCALAYCYEKGWGVPKDEKKTQILWDKIVL